jgi:hypothetical protein
MNLLHAAGLAWLAALAELASQRVSAEAGRSAGFKAMGLRRDGMVVANRIKQSIVFLDICNHRGA